MVTDLAGEQVPAGRAVPERRPRWQLYLMELRAPFFTASVIPVFVGTALAFYHTGGCHWDLFLLTIAGMVFLHAGANVINDYFDHLSGDDEANVEFVRPFTGGSRMIQQGLLTPREVLGLALSCFAIGSAIGIYLATRTGIAVIYLGIVGVLGGFLYVFPRLNLSASGLGEFFVGANLGVLPAVGAYFVQTRVLSWDAALIGTPTALLITAVLFINQFQDYKADRSVGKRNWVVRLGRSSSVKVYVALMTSWALFVAIAIFVRHYPALLAVAIIPVAGAVKAINIARVQYDSPATLAPANALTIVVHLAVGLLISGALVAHRLIG